MTIYEWFRWLTFPIMPTHLSVVHHDLKWLVKQSKILNSKLSLLDVGGRKSPYTINLAAEITLLDIPQEEGTRKDLNLGFTDEILTSIKKKRSNIKDLIVQDMTQSTLSDESYHAVVCVEVIEHVAEDHAFVGNISKVIKPGGWAYFTTPNGDYIKNEGPNKNPDHVRHYTKQGLHSLLESHFKTVELHYAVATGKYRVAGLRRYSAKHPIQLLKSISGNIINRFQSMGVENRASHTAHLIAICYK